MDTNPTTSHEILREPVEIRAENEITIPAAMQVAQEASLSLGLSTMQRWAKAWAQQGLDAKVKTILVTTRQGKLYKLDRDDFQAWVFEQKQNARPQEAPSDLERPHEISRDPARSQETSGGSARPQQVSHRRSDDDRVRTLESENMNLKIDLGVRKQLLDRAKEEMDSLRAMTNTLLRENGALSYQIHQLAPPKSQSDTLDGPTIPSPHAIDGQHVRAVDNHAGLSNTSV